MSIDFIFSFDSLVHVEAVVIEAYLHEFARTLNSSIFRTLGDIPVALDSGGGWILWPNVIGVFAA